MRSLTMSSSQAAQYGRRRTALQASGLSLLILSFQTLGIIYSDIGTSPLYVLNGIWSTSGPAPSKEDVIGGVSAIIWSLTLLPLIKYVIICLQFGTHEGEGGTFALFQGLYPPKSFETAPTRDSLSVGMKPSKLNLKAPPQLRWTLLIWSLFGTSLTMADGVLTAAVSVTSAVGGIAVAKPSVSHDIIGISCGFLVALFLSQPFGTARLATIFAPITCTWLLLLAVTGIINITSFPGIFRAFDPSRAIMYFVRTGDYDTLAGVLLAVTGCEALFANLGQFNMLSIQISFSTFVYPSLVLAYLGQGSKLIVNGDYIITNVFYTSIPGAHNGPLFWIMYVFAILATLIASQAMITATFSLVQQLVNMKSLPPFRMVHTSDKVQGQVYIPAVNWILMIGTIAIVAAFKNATQLTNAYGFAVATVMFSTTVLISIQMRYVKHLPIIVALAFFVFFGFLDGLFWGAALKKVPDGAWVPLTIGCVLLILMTFWNWAKGLEDRFDGANRRHLSRFIVTSEKATTLYQPPRLPAASDDGSIQSADPLEKAGDVDATYYCMVPAGGDEGGEPSEVRRELGRLPVLAVFHKMAHERGVPHSFISFIRQWPALPRFVIFLSVNVLPIGHVTLADRYVVDKIDTVPGFYGVSYYLGFRDEFEMQMDEIVKRLSALEARLNPTDAAELIKQLEAVASTSTHVVPHYDVQSRKLDVGRLSPIVNWIRAFLIEDLYRRLCVMFPETVNWLASADEIIHIGVNARI
ncbi:potassium transporter [Artomyces pyxidatus]|uniref:Potassium transporter n=1 Tax=Artomyces pyxidatus TaxID=48021 RepID=A0ACB8SWS6_9AGAM|nr:potassium transporter [Artomyces pyxidatus]